MKTNAINRMTLLSALFFMIWSCTKDDTTLPAYQDPSAALNVNSSSDLSESSLTTANYSPYYWSDLMIRNVTDPHNIYINGFDSVRWAGQNGATGYYCATDCSGLITALLKQTYNYTSAYFKS